MIHQASNRTQANPRYWVIFGLLMAFALLEHNYLHWFQSLDMRLADHMTRSMAAERSPSKDVVIIDIDERSLAEMSKEQLIAWPWPRSVFAEMLEGLAQYEPRAYVFDILMTDPHYHRPQDDAYLNEVLLSLDKVYTPMLCLTPCENANGEGIPVNEYGAALGFQPSHEAEEAYAALLLPGAIDERAWRLGTINFNEDDDGIGRRYDLYTEVGGWRLPSLPARVAQDLGHESPVDEQQFMLKWQGDAYSYSYYSFSTLYRELIDNGLSDREADFKDRVIIFGSTAPALHDMRATPMGSLYPGVEILATAIDNLMQGESIKTVGSYWLTLMSLLLLAVLAWLFLRGLASQWIGTGLIAISAGLFAAAWISLSNDLLLPIVTTLILVWTGFILSAVYSYMLERQGREQTELAFKRTMDPRVVERMIRAGVSEEDLKGQARDMTVLFSDIRGFTTLSESRSADEIVDLLNRYFSMQVDVIFKHHGTLDKFIGDAIMAFWGAPEEDEQHAEHAVAAALDMVEQLKLFQQEVAELGIDFDIGIGLHSGPAVAGFIGSETRRDYTVIGDTVNLASRIEGLTKNKARILISEDTRRLCSGSFDFTSHGTYKVKGREQEVEVFEPGRKPS